MEVGRIFKRDPVQREVVTVREDQDTRIVLVTFSSGLLGEIPPRNILSQDLSAAPAIDYAVAHHTRIRDVIPIDDRFAAVAILIDGAAYAWPQIVIAGIAGPEQYCASVND